MDFWYACGHWAPLYAVWAMGNRHTTPLYSPNKKWQNNAKAPYPLMFESKLLFGFVSSVCVHCMVS